MKTVFQSLRRQFCKKRNLYQDLGLNKQASQIQIERSFKQLALNFHSDQPQGNSQKFNVIKKAYQVLSDPLKKMEYDNYQSFVQQNPGKGQIKKGMLLKIYQSVSLQQAYTGCVKKVQYMRHKLCKSCQGKGGQYPKVCSNCQGKKFVKNLMKIGPGMYTQINQFCSTCEGRGKILQQQNKCNTCNGQAVLKQRNFLQINIEKGCPNSFNLYFKGLGNQQFGLETNDLQLQIKIQNHSLFTRKGLDLFIKHKISLFQALTQVQFELRHLNGKNILIKTQEGQVVKPKSRKCIKGMGMPSSKDKDLKGNLYVQFQIQFPNKLNKSAARLLSQVLPNQVKTTSQIQKETFFLQDYEVQQEKPNNQGQKQEEINCNQQ